MAVNVQQLEANGVYEGKSSVTTLLADLDQIITLANAKAAAKSKQGKLGGYMILAGVIAAVIGAFAFQPLMVFAILGIVAGLGVWLHSLFTRESFWSTPNAWRSPKSASR